MIIRINQRIQKWYETLTLAKGEQNQPTTKNQEENVEENVEENKERKQMRNSSKRCV